MAPKRVHKLDYRKITENDVICPICRSILIKPVTLPCSHGFCSSCLETVSNSSNVVCPLCRVRVGSWLRSATKSKKLINETLWKRIQELFPSKVMSKLHRMGKMYQGEFRIKQICDQKKRNEDQTMPNTVNVRVQNSKKSCTTKLQYKQKPSNARKVQPSTNLVTTDKKIGSVLINNFATKEYTCRILCQNLNVQSPQQYNLRESTFLKKSKIQEAPHSELSNERCNSIESECLYFKPIDYRHNPLAKRLTPIKVPTRRPVINSHFKILAPSGQNQISLNYLESAFARLCSVVFKDSADQYKKENETDLQNTSHVMSLKRKDKRFNNGGSKKLKSSGETCFFTLQDSAELIPNICDNKSLHGANKNSNDPIIVKRTINFKQSTDTLSENIKRALQEQADFELATKLQQTYNQSTKYSTRSSVLRMERKNRVKMEGLLTPYKVK